MGSGLVNPERVREMCGYRAHMSAERAVENYLIDMDGVLVWEERMIPGADRFIAALPYRPR
jgi:ribonucleotide monophosphatase NagD (HAD superfamily)